MTSSPLATLPTALHLCITSYLTPLDTYTLQALNRTFKTARLHRCKWVELMENALCIEDDETVDDWTKWLTPLDFLQTLAQTFERTSLFLREHRYSSQFRQKYTYQYIAYIPRAYHLCYLIGTRTRQQVIEHIVTVLSMHDEPVEYADRRVCHNRRTVFLNRELRRARTAYALVDA